MCWAQVHSVGGSVLRPGDKSSQILLVLHSHSFTGEEVPWGKYRSHSFQTNVLPDECPSSPFSHANCSVCSAVQGKSLLKRAAHLCCVRGCRHLAQTSAKASAGCLPQSHTGQLVVIIIPRVIPSRNSHIAKLWLSGSFEVLWKGMNTCRGIAALVLVVLELNWEMLAAGIIWLFLTSHLSPPFCSISGCFCSIL